MQYLFDIEPFTKTYKQDYLLIIPPGHNLTARITYYKLKAWELIGAYPSLHSTPHITINHDFNIQASVFEEKLIYYKRKVGYIKSFEVKVCGFDHFRYGNNYTIYAKVEMGNSVKDTLSKFNQKFSKSVVKTPHIAIVQTITKEKFELLWPYFEQVKFECSFYADKINVLETPTQKFHDLPMYFKTAIKIERF